MTNGSALGVDVLTCLNLAKVNMVEKVMMTDVKKQSYYFSLMMIVGIHIL